MDKQQKQVIERLENIVYLYNRESRGWYDCNDIRLNSNDIKAIEKAIELIGAILLTEPYKGLTNGEVVKAVFPDIPRTLEWHIQNVTDDGWWNSPYEPQERSEE